MPEPLTCNQSPSFSPLLLSPQSPHPGLQTPSSCPPCCHLSLSWANTPHVSHSLSHYQLTRDGPGFCVHNRAGAAPWSGQYQCIAGIKIKGGPSAGSLSVQGRQGLTSGGKPGHSGYTGITRGRRGGEKWRHTNTYRSRSSLKIKI